MLYIRKDICLNYEAVIDVYAHRHSRKMILTPSFITFDIVKFDLFIFSVIKKDFSLTVTDLYARHYPRMTFKPSFITFQFIKFYLLQYSDVIIL